MRTGFPKEEWQSALGGLGVCLRENGGGGNLAYCNIDFVEIACARHSWNKLRSALAYCNIALLLLFEEVEKKVESSWN